MSQERFDGYIESLLEGKEVSVSEFMYYDFLKHVKHKALEDKNIEEKFKTFYRTVHNDEDVPYITMELLDKSGKQNKPDYYKWGEKDYELYVKGEMILSGHQADVREKIEEMLEEVTDIYHVSLQESSDEGYFQVYLHSDNEQEDFDTLDTYDLDYDMDEDKQTRIIKEICKINDIKEVVYND
ncbi:hypothetical protein [Oceanobacillus profundus]|uniref:Uncharacterized protein n=1 Tax=Oceanobacillus profundus TaxID=372463 RepID=A0A417YGN0_9BACI|nr:hypothetical protein [Oceanobacillus profundus]RHW31945.1 hypothetical protein D1B32_11950 [Oceanobacillus profundus]